MSNRLLSLLIITIFCGGAFGIYYYFFVASTGNVSLIINGSGNTSITLTSEFGSHSIYEGCEKSCLFNDIPAVNYTISAKQEGYVPITQTFKLERGEVKKVVLMMEKEITLTEQKKKKEDTIATLKLKKDIQETIETNTGSVTLGYRAKSLYYALPSTSLLQSTALRGAQSSQLVERENDGWSIFMKKEGEEAKKLFKIPDGELTTESLDIYEGYIALSQGEGTSFYSLSNGEEMNFKFDGKIVSIKDTLDTDTKIITSDTGVFMYTVSEKTARINPLYDDIIQLSSGEIIALVKKSSREKQSLLSIADNSSDYVFLIGQDSRERRTLLKTPKNGKMLRYKNGEILFVEENEEVFVVSNVK